jgi:predicted kinase
MYLLLMCGPAFSGKTTLSRLLASELSLQMVSYDDLLVDIGFSQTAMTRENWRDLHKSALAAAAGSLESGLNVVVDDTFPRRSLRNPFRNLANKHGANFLIIEMMVDRLTLKRRVENNLMEKTRRHVSWPLIEADLDVFERPTQDEPTLAVSDHESLSATLERLRARLNSG